MNQDNIQQIFKKQFGQMASVIAQAPGRINLIGEHTDYNDGWVLPAAIDKVATAAIRPNDVGFIRAFAWDMQEAFHFSLDKKTSPQGWQSYVVGVLSEMHQRSPIQTGLDILLTGDVPLGAGLSSSAALECAIALAVDTLLQRATTKTELAHICQMAEHHYAGVQCGIMDQYASMMGKAHHALCLDCRQLSHQYIPLALGDYTLLLCHTNVSHSLADSAYNRRRLECEQGVAILQKYYPKVAALRDVDEAMLQRHQADIQKTTYLRCLYVVQENARVHQAVAALAQGDVKQLGQLMYASHDGLSRMYDVSCPELDFLVEMSRTEDAILGARMMGGGFGGCTINIIQQDAVDDFVEKASIAYEGRFARAMTHYQVRLGDGAMVTYPVLGNSKK